MAETAGQKAWTEEKKKLTEQLFINPEIETSGFPTQPWTPYFRTNNFIQQGLNRLFGWNPTEKKWYPVFVDTAGRILTSPDVTSGSQVFLKDRECTTVNVFTDEVVPASQSITHAGEDVEEFLNKTVLVSASTTATVRVQFSDDLINWYNWKDLAGAAIEFSINNEKICFGFTDHTRYIRVFITNTAAAANTISLVLMGAV